MIRIHKPQVLVAFALFFALTGCKHEMEDPDCNLVSVTYTSYVKNIIDTRCISCHSSNPSLPSLQTYADVLAVANDGRLLGVLDGSPGFTPMPFQSDPLSDCQVDNIREWVQNGAPE